MRSLLAGVLALIAAMAAPAARADGPDVDPYLQAFYESALWNDGRWPVPVRKWTDPIRVRITGTMSDAYTDMVLPRLRELTTLAGLNRTVLPGGASDENFLVEFVDTSQLYGSGRAAGCLTNTWWNTASRIIKAKLVINLRDGNLRSCIAHELMHAMGFPGHPHAIDSVLSYVYHRDYLTMVDKMSLRVLYSARLQPGLYQLPAMAAARQEIVSRLTADGAPGLASDAGGQFIKNLVPLTIKLAEAGNVALQDQLGIAYTFGQVVGKDEKAGFAWFQRAAASTQPEWRVWTTDAMFMLGYALTNGRGATIDYGQGIRWYRQAASRGNIPALHNLGVMFRDGTGVPADQVEAYKWFSLAAEKKFNLSEKSLANVIAKMTADQIEEGRRRAAGWKPAAN